jgi:hypothetical protein
MFDFLVGVVIGRWTARRPAAYAPPPLEVAPRSTFGVLVILALLAGALWVMERPREANTVNKVTAWNLINRGSYR